MSSSSPKNVNRSKNENIQNINHSKTQAMEYLHLQQESRRTSHESRTIAAGAFVEPQGSEHMSYVHGC